MPGTAALVVALTSALFLLVATPSRACAQAGPAVARVAAIEGTAAVERFGSRQQSPLAVEAPLYRADTIHTGAGSRLRIAFDDETAVTLGELASLRITQIADSAHGGSQSPRLIVLAGTARFRVRPAPGRSLVETWTPTAVAAVRGTEYIVEGTAPGTAVLVIDGVVAVSHLPARCARHRGAARRAGHVGRAGPAPAAAVALERGARSSRTPRGCREPFLIS